MINQGTYRLHLRAGNSFIFRDYSFLDSDMQGFTVSYMPDGVTALTGDMGYLIWKRNVNGFDYGFPGTDCSISYFAEKVQNTRLDDKVFDWDAGDAIKELKESFKENYGPEDLYELENLLDSQCWRDLPPEVGRYQMYKDLEERFPDLEDWFESDYGTGFSSFFKYRYEMLVSVSGIILNEVRNCPRKPEYTLPRR
jgi:hypothetical protein